jgi:hypothetical protein
MINTYLLVFVGNINNIDNDSCKRDKIYIQRENKIHFAKIPCVHLCQEIVFLIEEKCHNKLNQIDLKLLYIEARATAAITMTGWNTLTASVEQLEDAYISNHVSPQPAQKIQNKFACTNSV